jgi:hypothetical protein
MNNPDLIEPLIEIAKENNFQGKVIRIMSMQKDDN